MLCVVGSSNTDLVIRSPRLPAPGETVLGGKFHVYPGGKGANLAVAAARAGAPVAFVASVGEDDFGRQALDGFKREGIDTSHIRICPDAPSGVALIVVDERGENLICVAPGANELLSPGDVDQAEAAIACADLLATQLEVPLPTVRRAVELATRHGVPVLLNPAPCPPAGLPDEVLRAVRVLIPNEIECRQLAGPDDLDEAARTLLRRGCRAVVVTRGSRGVCVYEGDSVREMAAPRVRAVDTVGAGDCFCALVAVGVSEGRTLTAAVEFALRGAALSVTRAGAQTSFPTREEIEGFRADPTPPSRSAS